MENCIFCKIVSGDIPSHKVYEDEHFMGFLDINPQSPGHVQVIPKKHYRWVWDLPPEEAEKYFKVIQKIAKAQQKAFGNEAVWSKIMGDEIFHAHVWVFPNPNDTAGDKNDFAGNAEKIRAAL